MTLQDIFDDMDDLIVKTLGEDVLAPKEPLDDLGVVCKKEDV